MYEHLVSQKAKNNSIEFTSKAKSLRKARLPVMNTNFASNPFESSPGDTFFFFFGTKSLKKDNKPKEPTRIHVNTQAMWLIKLTINTGVANIKIFNYLDLFQ